MIYLFSNIKFLLHRQNKNEELFYTSLGFDSEMIFNMVMGHSHPSPAQLVLISDAMGYTIDDLLRKNFQAVYSDHKEIKMLVVDVDGVMTDGGMYFSDSGFEIKKYNAKDGLALMRMEKNGIKTGMLSHGFNRELIRTRAALLGLSYHYTGQDNKDVVLSRWSEETGISPEHIAYLGDDLNDLPAMKIAGFTAVPSDAAAGIRKHADVVLSAAGGRGCVRELAELLFPHIF